MATDREREFGEFLRDQREQAEIDLHAVARQTRIPMRSLRHLEEGDFEKLPADIFVRGFLRSYADCVGLDRADVLERYRDLGIKPPAFSGDIVAAVRRSRARRADATPLPGAPDTDDGDERSQPAPTRKRPRTLLPRLIDAERESGRRGPVTVAVIILVIVATLTMSYLLRKPSSGSDGFTGVDAIDADRGA